MRIWTFKTKQQLDILLNQKVLSGDKKFILKEWDYFISPYNWMKKFIPKQNPKGFPIWAWTKKPDVNHVLFKEYENSGEYLIELEVPDELCLVSCFSLWHCVLNNSIICNFNDNDRIYNLYCKLEEKDIKRYNHLKERSWQRIFHPRFMEKSDYYQVCVHQISLDQVIKYEQI